MACSRILKEIRPIQKNSVTFTPLLFLQNIDELFQMEALGIGVISREPSVANMEQCLVFHLFNRQESVARQILTARKHSSCICNTHQEPHTDPCDGAVLRGIVDRFELPTSMTRFSDSQSLFHDHLRCWHVPRINHTGMRIGLCSEPEPRALTWTSTVDEQ